MTLEASQRLASLALTHVYYDPEDVLGLPSAMLALFPQALVIAYTVAIFCRRDIEMCHAFLGQMLCEACNLVLKRTIKQDRPQRNVLPAPLLIGLLMSLDVVVIGHGYGMPSSHAQFMGFFAIYSLLYTTRRNVTTSPLIRLARCLIIASISVAVCISRVYLAYHSKKQVWVGVGIGSVLGAVWFSLFTSLEHHGIIHQLLDLRISQWFLLKNTVFDHGLQQEWRLWRATRQQQQQQHKKSA